MITTLLLFLIKLFPHLNHAPRYQKIYINEYTRKFFHDISSLKVINKNIIFDMFDYLKMGLWSAYNYASGTIRIPSIKQPKSLFLKRAKWNKWHPKGLKIYPNEINQIDAFNSYEGQEFISEWWVHESAPTYLVQ